MGFNCVSGRVHHEHRSSYRAQSLFAMASWPPLLQILICPLVLRPLRAADSGRSEPAKGSLIHGAAR